MPASVKLVLDNFSEVYDLLLPWATDTFYDFSTVEPKPGHTYLLGRQQLIDNLSKVRALCQDPNYCVIFGGSAEGAWTLEMQLKQLRIDDLVRDKKLLLISGAEMPPEYPVMVHEHFLPRILDYKETHLAQCYTDDIFDQHPKPYKFLFLNGRARPHRRYLLERFRQLDILKHSLWTMLDSKPSIGHSLVLNDQNGIDLLATPAAIRSLPPQYEVDRYQQFQPTNILIGKTMIKQELFNQEWGEIYLAPAPYVDTYFSLVTETICSESNFSFRTEKIAKPLAMGHPFIVAANTGFYQDLRNMGFRTFNHVIDESFDSIDNAQQRLDRIVDVVQDLCQQDLTSFLAACKEVCNYNQQHLDNVSLSVRTNFRRKFFHFVTQHD